MEDEQRKASEAKTSEALAVLSVQIAHLSQKLDDIKEKILEMEKTSVDTRVAVGKLEIKNATLATLAGTVTGYLSSKFGG